jgi:(p)ppGpp synthase/HD superfamily hydrolase
MFFLLVNSLFICNPLAMKPALTPLVQASVAINSFTIAEAVVRTYSGNHPKVMAGCQQYLDAIRAMQEEGKLSEEDAARILDAVAFSAEKHQSQKRKNLEQTPYIIHPIGVSYNLVTLGQVRDAKVLIGALLHDTVEDTQATFEEIQARFGTQVEEYVREVTDDKSLPKEERKRLQIDNAHHKSPGAALIKLSDKLYNLSDLSLNPPADWSQERIDQYFLWAKEVVDHLPKVNTALKQAVDQVILSHLTKKSH